MTVRWRVDDESVEGFEPRLMHLAGKATMFDNNSPSC